ncbi:uncharacterized protein BXZ73DRAFT_100161 [Epithele typhae]|uniref:uncharacterized protein n=1 Tax=Epithele typhae TaxID=378194 RepID=UPI0020088D1E|nr:uncharacterized protein BXZ73DRAFT_100161 [Epithele typhae]KAH9936741.1 hypothetical protein BXZ73DRAFT_100161 [Epithele typhae]
MSLVDTARAVSEKCGYYRRRTKHPCPRTRPTPASWLQAVYSWRSEVQSSKEGHFPSPPAVLAARPSSAPPPPPPSSAKVNIPRKTFKNSGGPSSDGTTHVHQTLTFLALLLSPRIECLEATVIASYHADSHTDVDAPAIVDGLVAAVGSLPALRVLAVSVLCHLLADPPCAAEAFMRALDLDALARRLCVACPTLRIVVVLLSGVRGRANERVQRGPWCAEFDLYADRMGNPGHRGMEPVGEKVPVEPRDTEREAGEVVSGGAVQDELRSSRG